MSILKRPLLTLSCLVILFSSQRMGLADDTDAQLIAQAESQFQPITEERLAAIRTRLEQHIRGLDRMLARTPENVEAWESYLQLGPLREHLQDSSGEDVDSLQEVLGRLSRDTPGLGMPQLVRLRRELKHYLTLLSDRAQGESEDVFKEQLAALRSALQSYEKDRKPETLAEVGAILGWLADRRQAASLVSDIRKRHSHPNLRVALSSRLINSAVQREINLETPFTADFGGNSISGSAVTKGSVSATLVPDQSPAAVQIRFAGQTNVQGVVDYTPVTAHANGAAGINAGTRVTIAGDGLRSGQPWASAAANVCVYCIQTALPWPIDPLVVEIARSEVRRRQGEFNDTTARRAEEEIHKQLPGQIAAVMQPLNDQYYRNIRFRLQRLDAFPEYVSTRTTESQLVLSVLEASPHQMGAPEALPVISDDHDVALQLHESALNNVAASMFGDRTLTIRELQQLMEDLAGIPAPTEAVAEQETVSITFDAEHPITLRASDNAITLSITGKKFIAGRRSYPAMRVSVTFQLSEKDGIVHATLDGDPVIIPPRLDDAERKSLSLRETAIRRVLKNRLDRDLVKTVELKEIPLPASMKEMPALRISSASAAGGWLTVTATQRVLLKTSNDAEASGIPRPESF